MGQAPHAGDAPEEEMWAEEAGISHKPVVENRQNTQLAEVTALSQPALGFRVGLRSRRRE